ncbi:MAG: S1 RNA-binding domain-containing protein, partial [Lentisphaeria bacterium]
NIVKNKYLDEDCGELTLQTIIDELLKPSRDPRPQFELFHFDSRVHKPSDLEVGMILPGIITNVTKFGAFVNIGVHQDGLVHISEMANFFIKDPTEVVKVRQKVQVKVLSVDLETNRINLTMRSI